MTTLHRRALLWRLGLPICAMLPATAARAGYNLWTGEYTVTRAEAQARIDTRFPLALRYAQLFEVRVSRPRLVLDAAAGRAAITVDLDVRNVFTTRPLPGMLTISSKLRYDAAARAIRLTDPSADRIEFKGLSAADAQQLQAIGQLVAQEALRDYAIHTFTEQDLTMGSRVFVPGEITVVEDGIKVKVD